MSGRVAFAFAFSLAIGVASLAITAATAQQGVHPRQPAAVGGHSGGGAPHPGGGAPHVGGGVPHFGGGGPRMGGFAHPGGFGGIRASGHFGGIHGGNFHIGHAGHVSHGGGGVAARNMLHHGLGGWPGRHFQAQGPVAAHGLVGHQAGRHQWARHLSDRRAFDRNFRDRGRIWARRGGHPGFVGWVGPVFWPYAYDDLFDDALWPDAGNGDFDPFWAYGYDDVFAGVFWPFDTSSAGYGYAAGGRTGRRHRRSPEAITDTSRLCGQEAASMVEFPFDRIQLAITPSADQQGWLDALKTAAAKAADLLKGSCPTAEAITPVARLDAAETRLAAMVDAVKIVRGPLQAFRSSLSDEQAVRLNRIAGKGHHTVRHGGTNVAQACAEQSDAIVAFSVDTVEKAIQPNDAQKADLDELSHAAAGAADRIRASCPTETPVTATGRLDAEQTRLQALLDAVESVREPLRKFYGSLSDEQKAHFNMMSRQPPSG